MGLCASNEGEDEKAAVRAERQRSDQLSSNLTKENEEEMQIHKLLLLGAGESGKSTLFKQMISIYGDGFPAEERKTYTRIIGTNSMQSILTLCTQSDKFGPIVSDEAKAARAKLEELDQKLLEGEINPDRAVLIKTLWNDPGIQKTFENRAQYQLNDSAKYFFDKLDEIADPGYIPSEADVLRARVRTTGIIENAFTINENQFRMYDVGGQRNERKKWIHCFEGVTAVLFVAAISAYDQTLWEDEDVNRMMEALALFDQICNSRWFKKTSMILFLNKRDLFTEKIKHTSIQVCFPDYDGAPHDYDEAVDYIEGEFLDRNRNPRKKVFSHVVTATDKENVTRVFGAVQEIVIRESLTQAGLV